MTERMRPVAALLLCAVALCAPALAEEDIAKVLQQADQWRHRTESYAQALAACGRVIASPQATRDQKLQAYDITVDVLRRQRQYEAAVRVLDDLRKALPDDPEAERKALLDQMELAWQWNQPDVGIAKARELIARQPGNAPACAAAWLWLSRFLDRKREYEEAYQAAKKAVEADPDNAPQAAVALWHMAEVALHLNDMARCAQAVERLLQPAYVGTRHPHERDAYRRRYLDCLLRLERHGDACRAAREFEKAEERPELAQEWCLQAARALVREEKYDEARRAFERVFVDHPDVSDGWYAAQDGIVDVLRRQGKLDEAVRAARILLDASRDRSQIAHNTRILAELLKQKDTHVARANQVINYQRLGPAGADGQPGTGDDLRDPLAAFGYPSYPERERAFAGARKRAGDDARAARHRALTCLYTGHPKDALKHYADAFSRATGNDFRELGYELIAIGVRSAQGHPAGLERFVDFVNYGPAGKDGQPGTGDDLEDPFAALLK